MSHSIKKSSTLSRWPKYLLVFVWLIFCFLKPSLLIATEENHPEPSPFLEASPSKPQQPTVKLLSFSPAMWLPALTLIPHHILKALKSSKLKFFMGGALLTVYGASKISKHRGAEALTLPPSSLTPSSREIFLSQSHSKPSKTTHLREASDKKPIPPKKFPYLKPLPLYEEATAEEKRQALKERPKVLFFYENLSHFTLFPYTQSYDHNEEKSLLALLLAYDHLSKEELQIFAANLLRWKVNRAVKVTEPWDKNLFEDFISAHVTNLKDLYLLMSTGMGVNLHTKKTKSIAHRYGFSLNEWYERRLAILKKFDTFKSKGFYKENPRKPRIAKEATLEELTLLLSLLHPTEIQKRTLAIPAVNQQIPGPPPLMAQLVISFVKMQEKEERKLFLGHLLGLTDDLPLPEHQQKMAERISQDLIQYIKKAHNPPSAKKLPVAAHELSFIHEEEAKLFYELKKMWQKEDDYSAQNYAQKITIKGKRIFAPYQLALLSKNHMDDFIAGLSALEHNVFLTLVLKITAINIMDLSDLYTRKSTVISAIELAHIREETKQKFITYITELKPAHKKPKSDFNTPLLLPHDQTITQQQKILRNINAALGQEYYRLSHQEFTEKLSPYIPDFALEHIDRTQLLWNIAKIEENTPQNALFIFYTNFLKLQPPSLSKEKLSEITRRWHRGYSSRYISGILDYFATLHITPVPENFYPPLRPSAQPLSTQSTLYSPHSYPKALLPQVEKLRHKMASLSQKELQTLLSPWFKKKQVPYASRENFVDLISQRFDDLHAYIFLSRFLKLTTHSQEEIGALFTQKEENEKAMTTAASRAERRLKDFFSTFNPQNTLKFNNIKDFVNYLKKEYNQLTKQQRKNIATRYHTDSDYVEEFFTQAESFISEYPEGSFNQALIYYYLIMNTPGPWSQTQITQLAGSKLTTLKKSLSSLRHHFYLYTHKLPRAFKNLSALKSYQQTMLSHIQKEELEVTPLDHKSPTSLKMALHYKIQEFQKSLPPPLKEEPSPLQTEELMAIFLSQVIKIVVVPDEHLATLLKISQDDLRWWQEKLEEMWFHRETKSYDYSGDYQEILQTWQGLEPGPLQNLYKIFQELLSPGHKIQKDESHSELFYNMTQEFLTNHLTHDQARHIFLLFTLSLKQPTYRNKKHILDLYNIHSISLTNVRNDDYHAYINFLRESQDLFPLHPSPQERSFIHKKELRDFFWSRLQNPNCSPGPLVSFVENHLNSSLKFNIFFSRILHWHPLSAAELSHLHRDEGRLYNPSYIMRIERSLRSQYTSHPASRTLKDPVLCEEG